MKYQKKTQKKSTRQLKGCSATVFKSIPLILALTLISGCGFPAEPSAAGTGNLDERTESIEETVAKDAEEPIENEQANVSIEEGQEEDAAAYADSSVFDLSLVPEYSDDPWVEVNGNIPYFVSGIGALDLGTESYEVYSELDSLGRCGEAFAIVGQDIMPTEERGSIGMIKPTGWQTPQIRYEFIDGTYLYNRCHLIAYCLTGENANEKNLITGTRYLNIEGMLPFEVMTADYVRSTGNHVAYRSTPIFEGNNLLASGVLMEGYSIEDKGDGICFCVYCYNVQPGIVIDYTTGAAAATAGAIAKYGRGFTESENEDVHAQPHKYTEEESEELLSETGATYIINASNGKFHTPNCPSVRKMNPSNRQMTTLFYDELIEQGYTPAKDCN